MKLLIVVNPQIDFCEGGALEIPGATQLLGKIHSSLDNFDFVVGLREWHPADHLSFASNHPWRYPGQILKIDDTDIRLQISHCVQNQFGSFFQPPFELQNFDELLDLGIQKNKENFQELRDGLDLLFSQNEKFPNIKEVRITGLAHNDIFKSISDYLSENSIPNELSKEYYLIHGL